MKMNDREQKVATLIFCPQWIGLRTHQGMCTPFQSCCIGGCYGLEVLDVEGVAGRRIRGGRPKKGQCYGTAGR